MAFTEEELERYARHIVLRHVGGPGQQKLKAARVLVLGAGALGSPLIAYLTAAGIGTLAVVDDDAVSLSNLQRQVLHRTQDVGRAKVESAEDAAKAINPHVAFVPIKARLDESNARDLVRGYDVVADGSDNFEARYALSDACFHEKVTLVSAAVNEFDASLTTLKPHLNDADGKPNPSYRCLFPQKPPAGMIPTCAEAGVLGALTGMVGALQAIEVIREIVGFGEGLTGKLLLIDALNLRFETLRYVYDPANPLSGTEKRS